MPQLIKYFLLLGLTLGLCSPALAAEDPDLMTEDDAFAAVFENPADLLLNFRLVSIQLRNGNIKGAVATLERILTLSADNSEAQSLLAGAQYRLGNIAESRRMANELLSNPAATAAQKDEINTLLIMIDEAEKRFSVDGVVSVGGGIVDNPDSGSIGNKAYGAGELSKRANAHAFNTINASFNVTGRFIAQLPETVSIGLAVSRRDMENYNLGDTNSYTLNTRYAKTFDSMRVNAGASATAMMLDGRQYLDIYRAYVSSRHVLPADFSGQFNASVTRNVYRNSFDRSVARPASEKTGTSSTLGVKVMRSFSTFQLGLGLTATDTGARRQFNARESLDYLADASFLLFDGIATVGLKHSTSKYQKGNPDYGNTIRDDFTNTVLASYSIGIGPLIKPFDNEPRINFSASYGKTKSTIANFSKYAGQGQVLLVQPF
ncbi:MAG: tetratricopeptide repeat protein [Candidatus Puniceispirillales bacterium]